MSGGDPGIALSLSNLPVANFDQDLKNRFLSLGLGVSGANFDAQFSRDLANAGAVGESLRLRTLRSSRVCPPLESSRFRPQITWAGRY